MKNILIIGLVTIPFLFSCKKDYECTITLSETSSSGTNTTNTQYVLYEDISVANIKDIEKAGTLTLSSDEPGSSYYSAKETICKVK